MHIKDFFLSLIHEDGVFFDTHIYHARKFVRELNIGNLQHMTILVFI